MKSLDLNANWNIVTSDGEHVCDLPYDVTAHAARDYTCAFGEFNGYIPAARATFTKTLPVVRHGRASIVIDGALGYGDVYVNDEQVGRICGRGPTVIDVTGMLVGTHNSLKLELVSSPEMNDKYVGLGVGGGVMLYTEEDTDIERGSLFVKTVTVGDKTYADVKFVLHNDEDAGVKFLLESTVLNARGKRCGKKQKKIFARAHSVKTYSVRVRIGKAYEWTPSDPYMYTLALRLSGEDGSERTAETRFGIAARTLNAARGLYINGKNVKLFGAYVSHADAALGGVSNYIYEKRRFEALKSIGYNAVHFVGCPTQAALDALDDVGMYAYVDIYDVLTEGKTPLDGHIFNFYAGMSSTDEVECVIAMRNHPCVALYGVADDVPECYGRNGGYECIKNCAYNIRQSDDSRPVTVSAREFVPTTKELEQAGIRKRVDSAAAAINAGREKDIFDNLTAGAFESVDVCGLNYLYPIYETYRQKHVQPIVGSRTSAERAFESIDEAEKYPNVIGDFCDCGMDYPGGGKLNEIVHTGGDIDAIADASIQGVYKSIILGARNAAHIAVLDPETEAPVRMWNWPRHLGQTVTVCVYTSGDVAALYLDGKLIGRKLAGKINKHIATFTTEYYPGTLEAVCYFKGVECARATLKTAGSPKALKLTAYEKNLNLSRDDVGIAEVSVCDRDGNVVPYAMRNITAAVEGAELLAFINADPMMRKSSFDSCPAYGGKALCVIKPTGAGKATVKVSADGLVASRISFKIKD